MDRILRQNGAFDTLTRWLTIDEVCHIAGISRSTFYKWRNDGHGPQMRRLPIGTIGIKQEWLDESLDHLPVKTAHLTPSGPWVSPPGPRGQRARSAPEWSSTIDPCERLELNGRIGSHGRKPLMAAAKKPAPGAVTRRARTQRDDSRARLVEAALGILLEGGIDAVRIDDVVAQVGVTKGSLYWHFSDRTELIREALLEHVRRLNAEVVEGVNSAITEAVTTDDYLVRIAPFIIDPYDPAQSLDRRRRLTLMMQAHADPVFAPLIREVQARSLAVYTDLMREAQTKGFIRPELDPAAVAAALHAINFGSVIIDVLGEGAPSRDAWWGLMMFFIGSLFTPPGAA